MARMASQVSCPQTRWLCFSRCAVLSKQRNKFAQKNETVLKADEIAENKERKAEMVCLRFTAVLNRCFRARRREFRTAASCAARSRTLNSVSLRS